MTRSPTVRASVAAYLHDAKDRSTDLRIFVEHKYSELSRNEPANGFSRALVEDLIKKFGLRSARGHPATAPMFRRAWQAIKVAKAEEAAARRVRASRKDQWDQALARIRDPPTSQPRKATPLHDEQANRPAVRLPTSGSSDLDRIFERHLANLPPLPNSKID